MPQINIRYSKKGTLIDLLSKDIDRRRNYTLYIASCYFNSESAKIFIQELRERQVRISKVIVYIDRKTAVTIRQAVLNEFCNYFENIEIKLYAVDTPHLFHTKAYALISYNNDEIISGSLVISSANLTGSGIINRGNIESFLDTQEIDLLNEFIEQFDTLRLLSIDEIEDFNNSDSYDFKYALLQQGLFIHKWADNLKQYLSIKYTLNDKGKQRIGDDTLREIGFNIETATISKGYFNFDYEPPYLENTKNLTRNYGIETYLGYWIPKNILDALLNQNDFENFKNLLERKLSEQLEKIHENITNDFNYLRKEGIIDNMDSHPVNSFDQKRESLLNNELKLQRIFSKYSIFDLPYDMQQKEEIEDLFNEMCSLIESRTKKNISMRAFLKSISMASINPVHEVEIEEE